MFKQTSRLCFAVNRQKCVTSNIRLYPVSVSEGPTFWKRENYIDLCNEAIKNDDLSALKATLAASDKLNDSVMENAIINGNHWLK